LAQGAFGRAEQNRSSCPSGGFAPNMTTHSPLRQRVSIAALAQALAITHAACARADCIDDAAARHQVNAVVLRAIGWQESRLQPQALGHNANGSIDVGAFQINSIHLSELGRYGIDRAALSDGCTSAEVAAWHYRRQVERQGNSWQALGAYHSRTPARAAWYANRIATILMRWNALPSGALPFPAAATLAPGQSPAPAHVGGRTATPASVMPSARASTSTASTTSADAPAAAFQELAYLPPSR
jgi:hypothetical protein